MLSYKARRATPHCDNHDMFIDPDDPDRVMLGTDGGLYISHDRAKTWLHVNTLPIAEFYAISVDAREPYKIWGGTQDNGVLGGEAKPMTPGRGALGVGPRRRQLRDTDRPKRSRYDVS